MAFDVVFRQLNSGVRRLCLQTEVTLNYEQEQNHHQRGSFLRCAAEQLIQADRSLPAFHRYLGCFSMLDSGSLIRALGVFKFRIFPESLILGAQELI
jgi:hypothetical protein